MLYGMAEPMQAAIRRLGPAAAGLRTGRRAGAGHGLPGAPAAGEHVATRASCASSSPRAATSTTWSRRRRVDRLPGAGAAGPSRPPTDADDAVALRARAPWPSGAGPRSGPPARPRSRRREHDRAVIDVPAVIGGRRRRAPPARSTSVDPARRRPRRGPRPPRAAAAEADAAVAAVPGGLGRLAAHAGGRAGRGAVRGRRVDAGPAAPTSPRSRCSRPGKPWAEADGDVCEAIDFCEYYGREMLRLDGGGAVQSPPGERNALRYQARGVGVVIAPWNFPLAIPTGMVTAALVDRQRRVLQAGRADAGHRLPAGRGARGRRPAAGRARVPARVRARRSGPAWSSTPTSPSSPSPARRPVGLAINETAAQHAARPAPRQAGGRRDGRQERPRSSTPTPISTRPCPPSSDRLRLRRAEVLGRVAARSSSATVYDELVDRLVGATGAAAGRPPVRPWASHVGPLIDADAYDARSAATSSGRRSRARVVVQRRRRADDGLVRRPDDRHRRRRRRRAGHATRSSARCSRVFRADDFDDAHRHRQRHRLRPDRRCVLPLAGRTSSGPAAELRAGNVYVNRGTTGAVVGRQPFGGYGLSGVGSKAGGPDYLLQFLDPGVTENTLRQGFAPR